jgi:hypothetical protein
MKSVRVKDYHSRIIEMVPALQQIPSDQAGKIITQVILRFFKKFRDQLAKDPYTILAPYFIIQKIYMRNKNAGGSKRRQAYLRFNRYFQDLADLDETYLPPPERAELEEWENNGKEFPDGPTNFGQQQKSPGIQKEHAQTDAHVQGSVYPHAPRS